MNPLSPARLTLLISLVMVAFAMNSLLCREALASGSMGIVEFTTIRLLSGAATLWLITARQQGIRALAGDWLSASALFGYAVCFSFAYVSLSAATGALLLFGAVQISMISWGLFKGERLTRWKWTGVISAFAGLVWFMLPGVEAPPLRGAALMIVAGICWGVYSLRGRGAGNATAASAGNFVHCIPMAVVLYLLAADSTATITPAGWTLAIASGSLASGLGYALWYAVLPHISAATSATVQLSVPIIAAAGGVFMLGEPLSVRLVIASFVVLGGIFIFINSGRRV